MERYIRDQVANAAFADGDFADRLRQFTVANPGVVLSEPTETNSGRYWYNLHVVLVTEERYQRGDEQWLGRIRDQSLKIAHRKGHAISCLSVMPDHLHIALRGNNDHSPQEIVLGFQNNLAYALGKFVCGGTPTMRERSANTICRQSAIEHKPRLEPIIQVAPSSDFTANVNPSSAHGRAC